ncbi:MAG: hypothetical protein R2873_30430 [Caldilineaceae bacterium]
MERNDGDAMMDHNDHEHDPLRPHGHDQNPAPPSAGASFVVTW